MTQYFYIFKKKLSNCLNSFSKSVHRMLRVLLLLLLLLRHNFPLPTTSWWGHLMPAFLTAPRQLGHMPPAPCHLLTTNYHLPPANCHLPNAKNYFWQLAGDSWQVVVSRWQVEGGIWPNCLGAVRKADVICSYWPQG